MSRPRQVRGLKHVTLERTGPWPEQTKLKGRAAEGIRYQNKALDELRTLSKFGEVLNSPWFCYHDSYGRHWCQPDALVELPDRVLIVEVKLSLRRLETAIVQLTKLYKPTVERFYGKPAALLVVFKHWLGEAEIPLVESPEEMVTRSVNTLRQPYGWHFLT